MRLLDIVGRDPAPAPWVEGEGIPWYEPGFSARMLGEHLTQDHDMASRRGATIDRQVGWLHNTLLGGRAGRVLDLGCGPGLYGSHLARLGHSVMGIDWSPASVAYAREQAEREGLTCRYVHADFRVAEYGAGYDMAMLIFGELNVFRPTDARHILTRMREALAPGGVLVLEPQTFATVQAEGQAPPSWYSSRGGLFSERPHLLLEEHAWDSEESVATTRFFVVDAAGGDVTRYAMSVQAYTDVQYIALLRECGLRDVRLHPSLTGSEEGAQPDLLAITAYR